MVENKKVVSGPTPLPKGDIGFGFAQLAQADEIDEPHHGFGEGRDKAALEERLAQPLAPAEIADAGRRLKACSDEINQLEETWLDVSGALEALSAGG